MNAIAGHAGIEVALANEIAVGPHFVYARKHGQPNSGKAAEFPRLHQHPAPETLGPLKPRRPLVPNVYLRVNQSLRAGNSAHVVPTSRKLSAHRPIDDAQRMEPVEIPFPGDATGSGPLALAADGES